MKNVNKEQNEKKDGTIPHNTKIEVHTIVCHI